MISAMVPIAIPPNATPEIILMALCDFLDTKYRRAINNGRFISAKVRKMEDKGGSVSYLGKLKLAVNTSPF